MVTHTTRLNGAPRTSSNGRQKFERWSRMVLCSPLPKQSSDTAKNANPNQKGKALRSSPSRSPGKWARNLYHSDTYTCISQLLYTDFHNMRKPLHAFALI